MPIRTPLFAMLLFAAACDVGEIDPIEENDLALAAGRDPCQDPNIRSHANVSRNAEGRFVGTPGRDIIFGTPGDDQIFGGGGDDLICALDGDDYIDGGGGRDAIHAGPGKDIVHGRGGSDRIWGGPGADILFGDILDDKLYGQDGDDTLIGGHGTDTLDGGNDDDFMRGDTGNDFFLGGPGYDVASFATALPPGQPEVKNDGSANPITGVNIDFNGECNGGGCADGDGGNEQLGDIESIMGSPFVDRIAAGARKVQAATSTVTSSTVYVVTATGTNDRALDAGVIVLGSTGNDAIVVTGNEKVITVSNNGPLAPGAGCTAVDANTVRCDVTGKPLHFVSVWGDDGADSIDVRGSFPREFEAHASGGKQSDHLIGAGEQDVFFTGVNGEDWLEGMGGDDALLSESEHTLAWRNDERPEASTYNDGADRLDGGDGNDQLVADYVCGGHRFLGGDGKDIAGFARSGKHGINAQLGGPSAVKTKWYGKAANMDLCGNLPGRWTTWKTGDAADLEILEASDGADHLWGDDRANTLWSRGGGDVVYGLGGNDEILGADGRDTLYGGTGNNDIHYGDQTP